MYIYIHMYICIYIRTPIRFIPIPTLVPPQGMLTARSVRPRKRRNNLPSASEYGPPMVWRLRKVAKWVEHSFVLYVYAVYDI